MAQSQFNPCFEAQVLVSAGTQTLEHTKDGKLVVCNGILTDWVTIYDNTPTWAADGVLKFNMPIRKYLNKIAKKA